MVKDGECRLINAGELSDVDWWYLMMVNDITTVGHIDWR